MKKMTKAQLEAERVAKESKRIEMEQKRQEKVREKIRKAKEAEHRAWLRKQRSRPRTAMPAEYNGETIYVSSKHFDKIMKDKKISVTSCLPKGGSGGKLVIEYATRYGRGTLELIDLGPMP